MSPAAPIPGGGRRSFSLVEILAAVAIVAVLASLLLPAAQRSLRAARKAQTAAVMRQIGIAVGAYAADHDTQLPGPVAIGMFSYGRFAPLPADSPGLNAYLAAYYLSPTDTNFACIKGLGCPALSPTLQQSFGTANWIVWDYLNTPNPDNRFGDWAGATIATARACVNQPRRMAALSEIGLRTPILSTADKGVWNSAANGPLPATGVFGGQRMWLFLDGSATLNATNAIWAR